MPPNYLSNQMQGLGRLDEAVAWSHEDTALSQDPMAGGNLLGIYQDFGDDDRGILAVGVGFGIGQVTD